MGCRQGRAPPLTVLVLALSLLIAVPYTTARSARHRILPRCRTRVRPALRQGARQPVDRREGRAGRAGRSAHPGLARVETVYTRTGAGGGPGNDVDADVIGVIQYEFVDWRERKNANAILADLGRR